MGAAETSGNAKPSLEKKEQNMSTKQQAPSSEVASNAQPKLEVERKAAETSGNAKPSLEKKVQTMSTEQQAPSSEVADNAQPKLENEQKASSSESVSDE